MLTKSDQQEYDTINQLIENIGEDLVGNTLFSRFINLGNRSWVTCFDTATMKFYQWTGTEWIQVSRRV